MDGYELVIMLLSAGTANYARWEKGSPRRQLEELRKEYQCYAVCPEYHKNWGVYMVTMSRQHHDDQMLELALKAIRRAKEQVTSDDLITIAHEAVADCVRYGLAGPLGKRKLRGQLERHQSAIQEKNDAPKPVGNAGHHGAHGVGSGRDKGFALLAYTMGCIYQAMGTTNDRQEALKWYETAKNRGYLHYWPDEAMPLRARIDEAKADSRFRVGLGHALRRVGSRLNYLPSRWEAVLAISVAWLITLFPLVAPFGPVLQPLHWIRFVPPLISLLALDIVLAFILSCLLGTRKRHK